MREAESFRTHPRESSFMSLLSGWAQQGVQSYFSTQKILLELAMRQNLSLMHVLQDRVSDQRHTLAELADEGISSLVKAHQVLLGLARRQNDIIMTGVRERTTGFPPAVAMTNLLRRGVDNFIGLQDEFLKIANRQSHLWVEAAQSNKPFKGEALVDLAREAMDKFVHAEKQFLDAVAEETNRLTSGKTVSAGKKTKETHLPEMARMATEAFVDAQKKLWEVAGHQMNVNLKAAGRTMDVLSPLPIVPFSDLTRKGVQSFVEAQKALMEAVTRPREASRVAKHRRPKKHAHAKAEHKVHAVV